MKKIIKTLCGDICGTDSGYDGITAYKGIKYAVAKRWEYPKIITSWDGLYEANKFGACSYQPRAFIDEKTLTEKAFYYNEFRRGETYKYSEDCLFLNIWAPDNAKNLPVIFYIHGGGFTGGCGHEKHFSKPIWAKKNVIAVTINYRLGPLGFACFESLANKYGHTGNYGIYDQLTALQWIYENISAFGGNPNNITVMGQSAGAMSVQQLCISPLSKKYIAKAVMSSGGGFDSKFIKTFDYKCHYDFWLDVLKASGCKTVEELQVLPVKQLFDAWQIAANKHNSNMTCMPCIDSKLLPYSLEYSLENGLQHDIPYLMGSTSEDIFTPVFYSMAINWCIEQYKQNKKPSYCWHFERQLPGDENGAWHSSDLWYWFGTLENCWRPFTKYDFNLSDKMTDYLVNFSYTGNPNYKNSDYWQAITASQNKVMIFGDTQNCMADVDIEKLQHTMMTRQAVG